jgi:hypothetical protein
MSADLARALAFAARFHAASPYADMPFDPESAAAFLEGLQREGYLEVAEHGMLGGRLIPAMWNRSVLVAAELFWWSEQPGTGRLLRENFQFWALTQGAAAVAFSALCDANEACVRSKYDRHGYRASEISFVRRF